MNVHRGTSWTLIEGDCLEVMKRLRENSIDSVVTDPPYELGFMGRSWDGSGISFRPETWAAVLRVLKPGGYLLAFGGSRTFHRIACAIEDAGFEIRDTLSWLYGTGFPKSLDVSKAIDASGGNAHLAPVIAAAIKAARVARGVSVSDADKMFCGGTTLWSWYEGRPKGIRTPTTHDFAIIAAAWPELRPLAEKVAAVEREVLTREAGTRLTVAPGQGENRGAVTLSITAPATDAARQWEGWGTALKPAWEPVIMARKPFAGTVAANVQKWGTGALNIDGCRIDGEKRSPGFATSLGKTERRPRTMSGGTMAWTNGDGLGRWPANVLLDEHAAEALDAQTGTLKRRGNTGPSTATSTGSVAMGRMTARASGAEYNRDDEGGASRFFYVAKASRSERDAGCETLPAQTRAEATGRKEGSAGASNPRAGAGSLNGTRNIHPTVKPVELMRWLVRLVTPPGGYVFDPFSGSGTTGVAALQEGFVFGGCEREPEYATIAVHRLTHAQRKS